MGNEQRTTRFQFGMQGIKKGVKKIQQVWLQNWAAAHHVSLPVSGAPIHATWTFVDPRLGVLPNFISHRSLWRLGRTKVRKRCTWMLGSRELGGEVGYNPWTSPFLGGFAIRLLTSHHLPAQPSSSKCHSPPAAVNLALCVVHIRVVCLHPALLPALSLNIAGPRPWRRGTQLQGCWQQRSNAAQAITRAKDNQKEPAR